MSTLATTVDGLNFKNPFVIGSGPPGTNVKVIKRAFKEGWGGVIAKTVSLDSSKVVNVSPRYAKLHANDGKEVIGWENIELISDRKFEIWLEEFKEAKDECPDGILIASVMEEYRGTTGRFAKFEKREEKKVDGLRKWHRMKARWQRSIKRETGKREPCRRPPWNTVRVPLPNRMALIKGWRCSRTSA